MQNYRMDNIFIDASSKELHLPPPMKADSWIQETYSQGLEDRIVLAILRAVACERQGKRFESLRYLEIGANHPIRNSNTWLFYKYGARGCLVEANPELASVLRTVRIGDQVIQAAVMPDQRDQVEIHLGRYDELTSVNPKHISSFGDFGGMGGIERTISVPAININTLLERLSPFPDYISIDVEGLDVDLLLAMDFARFRPLILQAEPSERFAPGNTKRLIELMRGNEYAMLARTPVNCIFVDHRAL